MDKDEQIQGLLERIAALERMVQEQSQLIESQAQKILELEKRFKEEQQ